MKIHVIGGYDFYASWIPSSYTVRDMEKADLVIATGGDDWNPKWYGEPVGKDTLYNDARDNYEVDEFIRAMDLNKPIVGICRGAQGLCIFAGGKLVQHQADTLSVHPVYTHDGKIIAVSSSHHQAQMPYNLTSDKYKILAWSWGLSSFHLDGREKELYLNGEKEIEAVYYPEINGLAFQFHPEYSSMKNNKYSMNWVLHTLDNFMSGKIKV